MREVNAGEILDIKTGKYDANHAVDDGMYKFFTCALKPFMANTHSFDDEVIILPGNGANVGEVLYYKGKLEAYQRTYVLHNIKEYPRYLYYYFKKYWIRQITKRQVGSATNYIKMDDIVSFKIPLPPLDQQKKISAILDAGDAYRQKTKALIKKYDELTESLFLDMFGDPVTNPKGWEKVPTIKYCDCIVPGRDKPKSFTGNKPWITTADLNHLGYTLKSRNDIGLTDNEIEYVRARIIPKESVIMTCVGDLGIISINKTDIVMNQQLHAFICGDQLNNVFLCHNLSFQKPYMNKMASSTTVPYMNKTIANNTPTIVPPINLQNQFEERVKDIEAQKAQAQASLAQAEDLFNSLLQKAFKGELI